MRKATAIALATALSLGMAGSATAGGGTGNYEWKVSFSNTNPDSMVSPALTGPTSVYLWFLGCNTASAGPGMSAAEFDAVLTSWTQFGFTPANGYLNAGGATNLLLAVGGCPAGPVIAGSWVVFGASGRIRLTNAALSGEASTVDCDIVDPLQSFWPDQMRFTGCGTQDQVGSIQDWGNGCTADPVDGASWGSVKALYR